jgi:hypothetical protein
MEAAELLAASLSTSSALPASPLLQHPKGQRLGFKTPFLYCSFYSYILVQMLVVADACCSENAQRPLLLRPMLLNKLCA